MLGKILGDPCVRCALLRFPLFRRRFWWLSDNRQEFPGSLEWAVDAVIPNAAPVLGVMCLLIQRVNRVLDEAAWYRDEFCFPAFACGAHGGSLP